MRIFADYHTHTLYSHGKGTIESNVEAARRKGLAEVAITDHGPGHFLYGVSPKGLLRMRDEVDRLNDKYRDIRILLGVEANIVSVDGTIDLEEDIINSLDILLIGYHFGALPAGLKNGYHIHAKNMASRFFKGLGPAVRELNTMALVRAIERYPVKIITHPGAKADIDTAALAKAAARKGVALEINASHRYMTVEYVRIAKEHGASFVVSSDAHRPDRVGEFGNALNVALKAGITSDDIINADEGVEVQ